jgi:hypothetical protein
MPLMKLTRPIAPAALMHAYRNKKTILWVARGESAAPGTIGPISSISRIRSNL